MRLIATFHPQDINPRLRLKPVNPDNLYHRQSARGVVLDSNGKVAIICAEKYNYYKLPGGGVEEGETILDALHRELLEELGCVTEILHELGEIVEYRNYWRLKQTSYCYLAYQVGEKGEPNFTRKEQSEGFKVEWVDGLDEAINLIQNGSTHSDELSIKFMKARDTSILKAARRALLAQMSRP